MRLITYCVGPDYDEMHWQESTGEDQRREIEYVLSADPNVTNSVKRNFSGNYDKTTKDRNIVFCSDSGPTKNKRTSKTKRRTHEDKKLK